MLLLETIRGTIRQYRKLKKITLYFDESKKNVKKANGEN
jgi:hypothetical protein